MESGASVTSLVPAHIRWSGLVPGTYRRTWISPKPQARDRAYGGVRTPRLEDRGSRAVSVRSPSRSAPEPAAPPTTRPASRTIRAIAEQLGVVEVVRDDHGRHVALGSQLGKDRREPDPRLVVQPGVRLVENEQDRIADEQAGEGDPPLLAARELVHASRTHRRTDRARPIATRRWPCPRRRRRRRRRARSGG